MLTETLRIWKPGDCLEWSGKMPVLTKQSQQDKPFVPFQAPCCLTPGVPLLSFSGF